ncbi:hypothetical protein [Nocardia africana]|uniref:Uncharacterized protein n=1 Tax=Nocardia africana TaxID=134964 RepID=A0A378WP00_9NOCA|nr:hypothetical protein [Nocardia africana]MCC3314752.1 hypothetical protein [Nocardia africana]SUA42968.1 Uncharacterised protein [Nocardia africana]
MHTLARIGALATVPAMAVLLVIAIVAGRPAHEIAIYAVMLVLMTASSSYVVRSTRD